MAIAFILQRGLSRRSVHPVDVWPCCNSHCPTDSFASARTDILWTKIFSLVYQDCLLFLPDLLFGGFGDVEGTKALRRQLDMANQMLPWEEVNADMEITGFAARAIFTAECVARGNLTSRSS